MNQKDYSVHLGGISLLDTYGLIMTSKYIGPPKPKTKLVDIPGRDGALDLSEVLTGRVSYEQRPIEIELFTAEKPLGFSAIRSQLQNAFHGKHLQIIFDDDPMYYWEGRVEIDFENDGALGKVKINATVEPYKKWVQDAAEEWLWDSFDFEEGVINEMSNVSISGTQNIEILVPAQNGMIIRPVITSTANMTVSFEGKTLQIGAGQTTIYDFNLHAGYNTLIFKGNGKVTISYRGGSL